jgi:hypothetical protein
MTTRAASYALLKPTMCMMLRYDTQCRKRSKKESNQIAKLLVYAQCSKKYSGHRPLTLIVLLDVYWSVLTTKCYLTPYDSFLHSHLGPYLEGLKYL